MVREIFYSIFTSIWFREIDGIVCGLSGAPIWCENEIELKYNNKTI